MKKERRNSSRTDTKRRRRWWIIPPAVLAVPFLLLAGIWAFRRPIVRSIVGRVNQDIPGQITIDGGSLNWRRFFTRLSLTLENTVLSDDEGDPVISSGELTVIVNPLALAARRIDVELLILSDVEADLEMGSDGSFSLYRALGIMPGDAGREPKPEPRQAWRRWNADLDMMEIRNVRVSVDHPDGDMSALLEYLTLRFNREGADGDIDLSISLTDIESRGIGPGYFRGKDYTLDLLIDVQQGIAGIRRGVLGVEEADILVHGSLGLYHPFDAQLGLSARGADTELLLTFLPSGVTLGDVEPVGNGEISIEGAVYGPLAGDPEIYATVSCRQFALKHVPTGLVMDRIGFDIDARRTDGPAEIFIRNLSCRLPDGELQARLDLENLREPRMDLELAADLRLPTLASFFVFPGSDTIAGSLNVDAEVTGRFSDEGEILELEREFGRIILRDFRYLNDETSTGIQNLSMEFRLAEGMMLIQSLQAETDIGDLNISGSFGSIWPLLLGRDGPIGFNLSLSSPSFNMAPLFDDPKSAAAWDQTFEDLAVAFSFNTSTDAIRNRDPLPTGVFRVDQLQTFVPESGRRLSRFSGEVAIGSGISAALGGRLNNSEVDVNISLTGYRGLLLREIRESVRLNFVMTAPALRFSDFIPGASTADGFWRDREMRYLLVDFELVFDNSEWFSSPGQWPDGRWTLNSLRGLSVQTGRRIEVAMELLAEGGDADLTYLTGTIGRSDFRAVGRLENTKALFDGNPGELSGSVEVSAGYFDMTDVFGITGSGSPAPEPDDPASEPESEVRQPVPGEQRYPDFSLLLALDEFRLDDYRLRNVRGEVTLQSRGYLDLVNLRLEGMEQGTARLKGSIDFSRQDRIQARGELTVSRMDLGSSTIPMQIGEESISFGDVIKGTLNGNVSVNALVDPGLTIDLAEAELSVNARLDDGRLVDFPPFLAMADRFNNERMRDVRLDRLVLDAGLNDGILTIPRTAVGSNLGYLELEGYSRLPGFMSYSVTVPNSVIDDLVTGLVFSGRTSNSSDEIINAENSGRFRTTVNVVGDSEDIVIGLGKNGRPRLEQRWERRRRRGD